MRDLSRPSAPNWYAEFRNRGEEDLRLLVEDSTGRGIHSSFLKTISLYRDERHRDKIKNTLIGNSGGRCQACETQLEPKQFLDLDHYRPKQFAGNKRKERRYERHYWWLIYDWNNFQILCANCNRYKSSLFPIEFERANEGAVGVELLKEGPLLLNSFDDVPHKHLGINRDGSFYFKSERGKITIAVYGLNRLRLVDDRKKKWSALSDRVSEMKVSRVPTVGTKKDAILAILNGSAEATTGYQGWILNDLIMVEGTKPKSRGPSTPIVKYPTTANHPGYERLWIQSIKIENFCLLSDIDITFQDSAANSEPWLGIVGENGVGKTSFLKAIALMSAPNHEVAKHVPFAGVMFNKNTRQRKGLLEMTTSDGNRRRLIFSNRAEQFLFEGAQVGFPVIAIGASRITKRSDKAHHLPVAGAIDNLFDPILPLVDAESWLSNTKLVSPKNFNIFSDNLKYLLGLNVGTDVKRRNGRIQFHRGKSKQSLDQMSDGFRSVIGLTVHIMKHLATDTPVMSEAEGTVLLDEIELHLHPRWKKQIVSKLRELFPRVRFVITTHDPLCLFGLQKNESHVFRLSDDGKRVDVDELNLMPGMNVDDILTGGWFGLSTTLDKETENLLNEYSALVLRQNRMRVLHQTDLEPESKQELEKVGEILKTRLPGFGRTEKEKSSLIDAIENRIDPTSAGELNQTVLQEKIRDAFGQGS